MNRLTGLPAVFCMLLCGCSTVAQVGVPAAPLVDYHQHLVSPAFSHIVKADPVYGPDLLKKLDAAGIEQAVVLSTGYSFADERKGFADPDRLTREENDWVSTQVADTDGRLIGFCSANPLREAALAELIRCLSLPGMKGIKLHFGNAGVSLRNPEHADRLGTLFRMANKTRTPILVHMRARGGLDFGAQDAHLFLDALVTRAPDTEIVIAHFGGAGPGYPDQADEVMAVFGEYAQRGDARMRNLYFDMASIVTRDSTSGDGALIAKRIRQVGATRVLFGSDLGSPESPVLREAWALIRAKLDLTPDELRTIANNRTRFVR